MREDLAADIFRYELMTGIVDDLCPRFLEQAKSDKESFGAEYGLVTYSGDMEQVSYARMVRFLVNVCGHSYDESLEAIVEHVLAIPHACRYDLNIENDTAALRNSGESIIDALFDLKVGRMIEDDYHGALEYNWRVTRSLMAKRGQRHLPSVPA